MSFFGVTKERIGEIRPHSNADRLEVANLEGLGFQFVVGNDEWKSGDKCLYFPLDSVIPHELQRKLGVEGRLSGKNRDRISAVRLRGEISMGIVCPLDILSGIPHSDTNIAEALGITKYEPPEVICKAVRLLRLPSGVPVCDIESTDRFPDVVKFLRENKTQICVSEKLEGTNFSITAQGGNIWVNQRNYTIKEIDEKQHDFLKVARNMDLIFKVRDCLKYLNASQVTLRGEMIGHGIQKNIYGLKNRTVMFFDIMFDDGYYMDTFNFLGMLVRLNLCSVPQLAVCTIDQWLGDKTVQQSSIGESHICEGKMREGIVIKPVVEAYSDRLGGRLVLKCHNPEYLVQKKY